MTVLTYIIGLLIFLFVLMASVALHELGHLSVAKKFGLYVPKYFVGFGKTVFSRKRGDTEYGVKAIPLGGYVLIEDSRQEEGTPERALLSHVSPMKRIAVFVAGPVVNLILGTVIIMITLMAFPVLKPVPVAGAVNSCSVVAPNAPAHSKVCNAGDAGMKVGDRVTAVDGKAITDSESLSKALLSKESASLTVDRDGESVDLNTKVTNGMIGITLRNAEVRLSATDSLGVIGNVFVSNVKAISAIPGKVPGMVEAIFNIKDPDAEAPSSIVAVGKTYGDTASSTEIKVDNKARTILLYSGLLNIGLGILNLLPIAPLDGGRILFALIDLVKSGWAKVSRRDYAPMSFKTIGIITAVTASVIFSFMGLAILSDVLKIIRGQI